MTKPFAFYNEIDPYAVAWLKNLVSAGHIAAGEVDARSVRTVTAQDVRRFNQAHFFAGIGCWSHALRLARWPDDAPVWTGSCPCQPFSAAGKRGGFDDDRHLWPAWFALIRECRPPVIFGEQVASPDGLVWLDAVFADLEAEGYAVGAADLCAAGVGAPHERQRLYFVAHSETAVWRRTGSESDTGRRTEKVGGSGATRIVADPVPAGRAKGRSRSGRGSAAGLRVAGGLADAGSERHDGQPIRLQRRKPRPEVTEAPGGGDVSGMAHANVAVSSEERPERGVELGWARSDPGTGVAQGDTNDARSQGRVSGRNGAYEWSAGASGVAGFWTPCDWLPCRDGKARPVEPGTFPLAHGVANRVGKLRAYGNAIVPQAAATFVRAYLESVDA